MGSHALGHRGLSCPARSLTASGLVSCWSATSVTCRDSPLMHRRGPSTEPRVQTLGAFEPINWPCETTRYPGVTHCTSHAVVDGNARLRSVGGVKRFGGVLDAP